MCDAVCLFLWCEVWKVLWGFWEFLSADAITSAPNAMCFVGKSNWERRGNSMACDGHVFEISFVHLYDGFNWIENNLISPRASSKSQPIHDIAIEYLDVKPNRILNKRNENKCGVKALCYNFICESISTNEIYSRCIKRRAGAWKQLI